MAAKQFHTGPVQRRVRGLLPLIAACLVAGCSNGQAVLHIQAEDSTSVSSGPFVALRDSDKKETPPATTVTMHTCPSIRVDLNGQNPWRLSCHTQENLPDGTHVTMQCWVSTEPPDSSPEDRSAKWFKVTVAEGQFSGEEGWIWSDLVAHQTPGRPHCASIGYENSPPPKEIPPPTPHLAIIGSCTSQGGTLHGVSSGFTSGGEYVLSATRPDGSMYPLPQKNYAVNGDGSISWTWPCAGDPAGTYATEAIDLSSGTSSGTVFFSIGTAATPPPQAKPSTTQLAAPPGNAGSGASPVPSKPKKSHTQAPPAQSSPQSDGHPETVGGVTHTWTNYHNAGGTEGAPIANGETVQITCRVQGFTVADGDTWWYSIGSAPWNGDFYASADAFYNNGSKSGSLHGTPFVDPTVPEC